MEKGIKIDTNAAYRHVPEKDFSKVIRDVQSPFTDTVIQEFCEELQKVFIRSHRATDK